MTRIFFLVALVLAAGNSIACSGAACDVDLRVGWEVWVSPTSSRTVCGATGGTKVVATVGGATYTDDCGANESTGQFDVPISRSGSFTVTASLRDNAGTEVVPPPPAQTVSSTRCEDIVTDYFTFYLSPF